MINFVIQIIASIFMGVCFVILAKRYNKNHLTYFALGFLICVAVRIIYLFIYGFFTDFKINNNFSFHRNISILLSVFVSYILFIILKKKIEKESVKNLNIEEIGTEKE